ncbi:hypothetical protein [Dongia sp.]|uniref:hypothetical protein n=1 Tax=Dongia sp. TaxID=1977262 RepID=UPI0035B2207C
MSFGRIAAHRFHSTYSPIERKKCWSRPGDLVIRHHFASPIIPTAVLPCPVNCLFRQAMETSHLASINVDISSIESWLDRQMIRLIPRLPVRRPFPAIDIYVDGRPERPSRRRRLVVQVLREVLALNVGSGDGYDGHDRAFLAAAPLAWATTLAMSKSSSISQLSRLSAQRSSREH